MPEEKAWVKRNPIINQLEIAINSVGEVLVCECCPCPATCRDLAWARVKVVDAVGDPATTRTRWFDPTITSSISITHVFEGVEYDGTLNFNANLPSRVCETQELIDVSWDWDVVVPSGFTRIAEASNLGPPCGMDDVFPVTVVPYFGESFNRQMKVSACDCYCVDSPMVVGSHVFGNIIPLESGLSTAATFELRYCYKPCEETPPVE